MNIMNYIMRYVYLFIKYVIIGILILFGVSFLVMAWRTLYLYNKNNM